MTAPQHNAKPIAEQPEAALEAGTPLESTRPADNKSESRYSSRSAAKRMQRSWLIALGLLGGSGFVANQMSFALAESDFLIDDYAAVPGDAAVGHTVADTTFVYSESTFEPTVTPSQVEYVPAPAPVIPQAKSTAPVEPDWVATYQTPLAAPVAEAPAVVEPVAEAAPVEAAAPVAAAPSSIEIEIETAAEVETAKPSAPVAIAVPKTSNRQPAARQATARQSNRTESQTAQANRVQPTVSEVASPTFSSVRKPKKASKVARRGRPLMGLVSANSMRVPLSNYVAGSMAIAPSMVQLSARAQMVSDETTTIVAQEGGSVEMEITPSQEAVPDILPAEAPAVGAPPIQPTELVPAALPEGTNLPDEYNSVFLDETDYSVGATAAPGDALSGAPEIVVSEQSTGCEFTLQAGQGVPNAACAAPAPAPAPVANGQAAPAPVEQYAAPAYVEAPVAASSSTVNVGPVSFGADGIRFSGSTTAAGREYLNRTVRPLVNLQASEQFIFPLAVPSPITSLFGFRTHPISGEQRFHAGTDIGAAQGTPVLAVQDGKVSAAGYAGGYGLMVVMNHEVADSELESRYAHLAEILVEPDAVVKKGDVIGLVGSTGNSTGPHLHFEMRQMTADGWVLVNADGLVQHSLANLVKALNNPMQALNFSMSDFNLLRKKTGPSLAGVTRTEVKTEAADSLLPGLNGIPFRPAQPNAS